MHTLSLIATGCSGPWRRALAAVRRSDAAELMLIPHKATGKSYLADLRPAVCAGLLANQRTQTTEFDLLMRDAAEADCRNDVEQRPDAVSAAAWSQSIAGEVGRGRLALLIKEDLSVERAYLWNISSLLSTAAMERLSALANALLHSAGMFAVRQRRSPCMD